MHVGNGLVQPEARLKRLEEDNFVPNPSECFS